MLLASEKLSEDTVKLLTELLFVHEKDIRYAASINLSEKEEDAVNGITIPFHKGAAAYYAEQARNAAEEVPGRVKKGKEEIDNYVKQKEVELKGETGNVYFAGFAVVKGRLKMYSDPTVDKVRFRREGSRLKYRLAL